MEAPVSRVPSWLHELIAEAKRRARQRRLLVVLLLVVVAGATAAVVVRPSGGGSRSGGSGRVGSTSASSHSVHFGPFVLTVPQGFHQVEARQSLPDGSVTVADDSRTARAVYEGFPPAKNGVALSVVNEGYARLGAEPRLPLDLHKLHQAPDKSIRDDTAWNLTFRGGGRAWSLTVFEGSKASAADRAAIERALRSIRRAS